MITRPTVIGAGVCSLLLTSLASAQEIDPALGRAQSSMSEQDLRSVERLLDSREREFLYPTEERDPLEIVGIDQDGNDFRAGTPALQNADMTVAMVDTEEARARLLSLYAGEQITPTALSLAASDASRSGSQRDEFTKSGRKTELNKDDDSGDSEHSIPWYYGVPLLGLAAAWIWTKSRH